MTINLQTIFVYLDYFYNLMSRYMAKLLNRFGKTTDTTTTTTEAVVENP